MCHCTPEATAYNFCLQGECNPTDYKKKIQSAEIKNHALLIASRNNARFTDTDFKWKPSEAQWETILRKCKEIGLSVVDTKELRKLENFHSKMDAAVRDYPNY